MATEAVAAGPAPGSSRRETRLAWWLVAGLVGADIGTSVFYSTGVLFPLVGFAAPFFVAMVAIALWLFKTTYQEGCAINPVNGGAYAMVLQTVGRRAALVLGSLTLLVYLSTAVVSDRNSGTQRPEPSIRAARSTAAGERTASHRPPSAAKAFCGAK